MTDDNGNHAAPDKYDGPADIRETVAYLKRLEPLQTERARLKAINAELVGALNHCINVLAEHERKPGDDLKPFMLGALDTARAALAKARKED